MEENVKWYKMESVKRTIANLEKNNMKGYFLNTKEELLDLLNQLISDNTTVGVGDSVTLAELGVLDYIRDRNLEFLDKYKSDITRAEKQEIYLKNFSSDTFMCSTNALTEKGELFNIDGNGSRVAPLIYGPDQVIIVTGINKIVRTLDEAVERVRQYSAPIDAKRLGKNTPCTKLGYCVDCNHPERICNDFVTITGQFKKDRIKVIIMNENFGY